MTMADPSGARVVLMAQFGAICSSRVIDCFETPGAAAGRSQPQRAAATARVAMRAMARNCFRPRVVAPGPKVAPATVALVKCGSASAAENSAAVAKRSAGSFSSALAVAAATFAGTLFRSRVTGCASSATIFMMICCAELPVWGGLPVSIS